MPPKRSNKTLVLPAGARPPLRLTPPPWVPDEEVSNCRMCHAPFTQLNRRHHCRQCGDIFCHSCSSKKIPMPQFDFARNERVCRACTPITTYVADASSDLFPEKQSAAAKSIAEMARQEDGFSKIVLYGGIGALIYLCNSTNEDVLLNAIQALHTLVQIDTAQNTIFNQGVLLPLFNICKGTEEDSAVNNLFVMHCAVNILFVFSRNVDICRSVISDGGFHPLVAMCNRKLPPNRPTSVTVQNQAITLSSVQGIAARTISYLSMNSKNQELIIEDRHNGPDKLLNLLSHENQHVRKYITKTFAYLSLRQDDLKPKILSAQGTQLLANLMETETVRETLSHASCTIANLATNSSNHDSQVHTHLLGALCRLAVRKKDDAEIQRHIARGLANLALYPENKRALVDEALEQLIALGNTSNLEIQRHVVRAIDNILNDAPDDIILALHKADVLSLLEAISTNRSQQSVTQGMQVGQHQAFSEILRRCNETSSRLNRAIAKATKAGGEGGSEGAADDEVAGIQESLAAVDVSNNDASP
ncbi:hypothetical protein H696_05142 [Fonticula alba]|uniref:FYVE-type domain-containing protein n=1 Tax=Fonticula alba TaxID=691883 RepID=A0A058Z247_FONAL|nr:hypothetical protein H696_05142 [Fonticula alba]KCV68216.1 hypothetical protein H696_05142 [Fonticula alba]|eukprot:XP_009497270.1 hypothetical protein H696_05142 [Fonticula alba]